MSVITNLSNAPVNLNFHVAKNPELQRRSLVDGLSFVKNMQLMVSAIDIVPMTRLVATNNIIKQGRTGVFAATPNAVSFQAREAQVRAIKGDITITEQEIENAWSSYVGMMYQNAGFDIQKQEAYINQFPFEKEVIQLILDKAGEEYRMLTAFKGTFSNGVNTPATADDGLITKMNAAFGVDIPGAQIVAMATPSATTMDANVKALVANLRTNSPAYLTKPLQIWMSPQLKSFYEENCLSLYGKDHNMWQQQFEKTSVYSQKNIEIIEEVGLSGSNRMFITTPKNLRFITDTNGFNLKVKDQIRSIDVGLDFRATLDFCDGAEIWTNTLA